ncbi:MAG: polysaccharide biosynthesis C-terminal domain-containing protein [Thermodesulfobacteriota bacterium]
MISSLTFLEKNRIVKCFASRLEFILPAEEDSKLFSLLVKGASGSFVLKVANTGFGLLIILILARILDVSQYGIYAYVMSWIGLLGVLAGLGLGQAMVRFIATYNRQGEWGKIKGLIRYSNIGVFVVSVFIILAVYLFMQIVISDKKNSTVYGPLLISLLLLPLNSIMDREGAALRGFHWIISGQVPSMLIRPLLYIILIGTAWMFLRNSLNIQSVIYLNIAATVVAIAVAGYLLLRAMPKAVKESTPAYELHLWNSSVFPIMLMGGMYMINGQADILMLGSIKGTEFSGIYQIADRGAGLIIFVLGAVIASFAPTIAHLYAGKNIDKLQRIVTKSARVTLLLSLPVALFLILFGHRLLGIFGSEFVQGYSALAILSISQLVNVASGPVANILVMTGHERDAALGVGISSLANVILNAIFIPFWGLEGAAVATGTSIITWNLVLIWFVRKRINIHPTVFGNMGFGVLK